MKRHAPIFGGQILAFATDLLWTRVTCSTGLPHSLPPLPTASESWLFASSLFHTLPLISISLSQPRSLSSSSAGRRAGEVADEPELGNRWKEF